jgi:hypothetical protein
VSTSGGATNAGTVAPASVPVTGALAETVPRWALNGAAAPASGYLSGGAVWLQGGQSVGHLAFATGSTPAVTPTHSWAAILNAAGAIVAETADQGAAALPASTYFSLAIATLIGGPGLAYVVPSTGAYFLAVCQVAATPATLIAPMGFTVAPPTNIATVVAFFAGAGALTGPPALPNTPAGFTAQGAMPWVAALP